jgi:pyruvyltransferase
MSIDIRTDDYRKFIDELCSCEKIISSSLHGIILAEAYGIPAVFLGEKRDSEMFKYYDWYISTGRKIVRYASSLDEAIKMEPMELPDLTAMQETIMNAFPYDLWK